MKTSTLANVITQDGKQYVVLPFKCPCCELPLYVQADATFFVYCPHGACTNQVCNDGACGTDIIQAVNNLLDLFRDSENKQ